MSYWLPFSDGYGIVGWNWKCDCGRIETLVLGGFICQCGIEMPDIDVDDWYDNEMEKSVNARVWNLK